MPSPIAHSLTGYALSKLLPLPAASPSDLVKPRGKVALAVVVANLPDLDFIGQGLGLAVHRGGTHSLVALVTASLLAAALARFKWKVIAPPLAAFVAVMYGSHLLLDSITAGGPGMKLLWPFSQAFYGLPWGIFPTIHFGRGWLYWGHLKFISVELLYGVMLLGATARWTKFEAGRGSGKAMDSKARGASNKP